MEMSLNGSVFWPAKGYGPTPWADTIGSNNGTESGTFEDVLIPNPQTQDSTAPVPIADSRTSKTFNADGSMRLCLTTIRLT